MAVEALIEDKALLVSMFQDWVEGLPAPSETYRFRIPEFRLWVCKKGIGFLPLRQVERTLPPPLFMTSFGLGQDISQKEFTFVLPGWPSSIPESPGTYIYMSNDRHTYMSLRQVSSNCRFRWSRLGTFKTSSRPSRMRTYGGPRERELTGVPESAIPLN